MRYFCFFFLIFLTSACVTNRQYQYLQYGEEVTDEYRVLSDSSRIYPLPEFFYRLQPEDIVAINIYSLTEDKFDFLSIKNNRVNNGNQFNGASNSLVNGYLLDSEGNVEFPVVGKIKISGLTLSEAEQKIYEIADLYLESPSVEVKLLNFRFTILGEVKSEGVFTSLNYRITIPEAIGLAGGLGELADKSYVKLIRHDGQKAEVRYINMLDEDFIGSENYYINQNDLIVVPPLKQRPFQLYFSRNLSLVISSASLILLLINFTR